MCSTGRRRSFPNSSVPCTTRWRNSLPKLRDRLRDVLARFLESGKASSVSENAAERRDHRRLRPWFSEASGGAAEAATARNSADSFYARAANPGGPASVVPATPIHERALAPEVPGHRFRQRILRRSSGRDSQPAGGASHFRENGRFVETWVPPSAEELEFLDRYGVHPEAGRTHRSPAARASLYGAPCRIGASAASSSRLIMATLARNSLPAATAEL